LAQIHSKPVVAERLYCLKVESHSKTCEINSSSVMLGTPCTIGKIPTHIMLAGIVEELSGVKPEVTNNKWDFRYLQEP